MAQHGFIHDKLDIKMLVLYLMARLAAPVEFDQLTELSLCDAGVDYFDYAQSVSELVESGHLTLRDDHYSITDKGRSNSAACESSLPYSVRHKCNQNLARVNTALRRNAQVRGEQRRNDDGSVVARMTLDDDGGNLMTIELLCPSTEQAGRLITAFRAKPERVYNEVLSAILDQDGAEE